ncbi:hypothetical protein BLNAU_23094 [Blattamonas nauphoetae]|uniref:Protein kinase domain-containing protein n=1 Tax=Blattamonas nauphoetae TaxID=2049346 RepID=A0ABQ9WR53_9EUKA|nr:hypothetical protein BLNAU_23094 [Blattamonas nauphoetae]
MSFSSHTLTCGNSLLFDLSSSHNTDRSKMELSSCLLSTSLANMTSTHNTHTPSDSRLSQTCLGVSVKESIGALQGTLIQDFNLGGSLLCQNTTFAICQTSPTPFLDSFVHDAFGHFLKPFTKHLSSPYSFSGQYSGLTPHRFWSPFSVSGSDSPTPPLGYSYATSSTPITFTGCTFSQMTADPDSVDDQPGGAAIRKVCQSPLTITRCAFTECNAATGSGGAVLCLTENTTLSLPTTIVDSNFTECSAGYDGGGVCLSVSSSDSITSCRFVSCSTPSGSGAAAHTQTCDVTSSVFDSNTASSDKILMIEKGGFLKYCLFSANTAGGSSDRPDCNLFEHYQYRSLSYGNVWSSDSWDDSSDVLFVMNGGSDGPCSFTQPCSALSAAVGKVGVGAEREIRIGSGSFGAATLATQCSLTIFQYCAESVKNKKEEKVSFSLNVDTTGQVDLALRSLSLSPIPGSALVTVSRATSFLGQSLRLVNLTGISHPLFVFSAGEARLSHCLFEDITGSSAPLLTVTGAATKSSIENGLFTRLSSTECVVSVTDGSFSLINTILHLVTRTEGKGAAGIDAFSATKISGTASISHCHSVAGLVGAFYLKNTPFDAIQDATLQFFENSGKDDDVAHDILVADDTFSDPPQPFYGFSSLNSRVSIVDQTGTKRTIQPVTSVYVIDENNITMETASTAYSIPASEFGKIDFSHILLSTDYLSIYFCRTKDREVSMSPLVLQSTQSVSFQYQSDPEFTTLVRMIHSTPLIHHQGSNEFQIEKFRFLLTSPSTAPMFIIDSESPAVFQSSIFTSDGTVSQHPMFQTSGTLSLFDCIFSSLSFDGTSCIVATGGSFTMQTQDTQRMVSAVTDISTTSNGAFLNAHSTALNISDIPFIDCCASNGGALFISDPPKLALQVALFNCKASLRGGGFFYENTLNIEGYEAPEFRLSTMTNCVAEFGGGFYLNNTGDRRITLTDSFGPQILGVTYAFPTFFDCYATKGGGGFIDGNGGDNLITFGFQASSNGRPTEGTDLYFSKSFAESFYQTGYEADRTFGDFIFDTFGNGPVSYSGRSLTDPTKYKHIEVEDYPEYGLNLQYPQLEIRPDTKLQEPHCSYLYAPFCSSISQYLPFIHPKSETGEYIPAPIVLQSGFNFLETSRVSKQSIKLMCNPEVYMNEDYFVTIQQQTILDETESEFVEAGEDGTIEIHGLVIQWDLDLTLIRTVHSTAKGILSDSIIMLNSTQTRPVLICENGIISVSGTKFNISDTPLVFSNPLISMSSASKLSNSALTKRLELSNVTFEDLTLHQSAGAVVVLESARSIALSNVSFNNVVDETTADMTRFLIQGNNLDQEIERISDNLFPIPGNPSNDSLFKTLDESKNPASPFHKATLLVYLHPYRHTTINIHEYGSDAWGCGNESYPCHSLDEADGHLVSGNPSLITIHNTAQLFGQLDLTQDKTEITSKGAQSTVVVSSQGSLINHKTGSVSHALTLSLLAFSLSTGRSTSVLQSTSGSLTVTSCVFSSASPIESSLLEVTGGSADLSKVTLTSLLSTTTLLTFTGFTSVHLGNVTHTACSSLLLMSVEGNGSIEPTVSLEECDFEGSVTSLTTNDEQATSEEGLCDWTTPLIVLKTCSATARLVSFTHLPQGAISVDNSKLKMSFMEFTQNAPLNQSFPSLSRNIRCTGTNTVDLTAASSNTDAAESSLWFLAEPDCAVTSGGKLVAEPYFVPTLNTTNCSSTLPKKGTAYSVVLQGTHLIPCGISFVVREEGNSSDPKEQVFPFTTDLVTAHNETHIALTLPTSTFKELDPDAGWIGLVAFGRSGETESFAFKVNAKEARALALRKTLPWLIPLIVSICVLVLVAIVIIVILRRRKRTEPSQPQKEMEDQIVVSGEEKMEEICQTQEGIHTRNSIVTAKESNDGMSTRAVFPAESIDPKLNLVEAVQCGEKLESTAVREDDTLYNRLHKSEHKTGIVKRVVQRQLALGLQKIAESNQHAPILSKLSSHWVMFDAAGSVCLKLKDSQPDQHQPAQSQTTSGQAPVAQEGRRWMAPEAVKAEEDKAYASQVDPRKAAVFSLGLVLWEIETGLVPFAEQDAVNAQRQLGTGVLPNMNGLKQEMEDLIITCLQVNPDDRPSLHTVSNAITSLPDDEEGAQEAGFVQQS